MRVIICRESRKSVRIKVQDTFEEPRPSKIENYDHPLTHDYQNNKIHSDYGHSLDSDIARLRMEVNLQHKSLVDQINNSKFKAKQAAQERDLAKNDLDRLIDNMRNKTNRFYKHERPLNNLKDEMAHARLRSNRDYGGSSHSRRNLDTYSRLYFNNFSSPVGREFVHNPNDPFDVNPGSSSQPSLSYGQPQSHPMQFQGTTLNTNSQAVALGSQPSRSFPAPDPLTYGQTQFQKESDYQINQISDMIHPSDGFESHEQTNQSLMNMQPLSTEADLRAESQNIPIQNPPDQIHKENLQQLDSVLESLDQQ